MAFSTNFWDITKSVSVLAMVVIIGYCGYKFINKPTAMSDIKKEIIEHVMKVTVQENTKQMKAFTKQLERQNNASIIAANARNDEKIKEIGTVAASLRQTVDKWVASGHTYMEGSDNVLSHDFVKIYRKDADGKKFVDAWAMYHPNQIPEKKWKTGTYPLNLHATVVQTENEAGKSNVYVDLFVEKKDKKFPIDIKDVQWVRKEIKNKRFSFNTRLGFTGFIGNDVYPGVDISLFSYGRTKRDLDWRFVTVGVGGNKDSMRGYFSPVQYNIGNFVPLIENMYIGPSIGIDEDLELEYGGGISVLF